MANNDSKWVVAEQNINTLMAAVQQLQDREGDKEARLLRMERMMQDVDAMQKQLYATLHTINLASLGAAVTQLQEKYRELKRMTE